MSATVIRGAIVEALQTVSGWEGEIVRVGRYEKPPNKPPFLSVSVDGTNTREGRDFYRLTHSRGFLIQIWLPADLTDSGPAGTDDILINAESNAIDAIYACFDAGGTLHGGTYLFDGFNTIPYAATRQLEITVQISE